MDIKNKKNSELFFEKHNNPLIFLLVVSFITILFFMPIFIYTIYNNQNMNVEVLASQFIISPISSLTSNANNITVEIYVPGYLGDSFKKVSKIFSGRELLITSEKDINSFSASLVVEKTNQKIDLPVKKKKGTNAVVVEIPNNTLTGMHILSFLVNGEKSEFSINTQGVTEVEKTNNETIQKLQPYTINNIKSSPITFRTKICDSCFWEMVFTGDPNNSSNLVLNGNFFTQYLSRSTDGGRTWKAENINDITDYPSPGMAMGGDPKFIPLNDGTFLLSAMGSVGDTSGGLLYKGGYSGRLNASVFSGVKVDFPKIAVHEASSAVYLSGNILNGGGQHIFVSRDNGKTFNKYFLYMYGSSINSVTVDEKGTLYAQQIGNNKVLRFNSFKPFAYNTLSLPIGNIQVIGKISSSSNRAWFVYRGPEIIADTNLNSPYFGRIYSVWAQSEQIITDPNFEFGEYGYNFDIFVSYSDDKGNTWSTPVRVNDDFGKGDQMFASAWIDSNGKLHIAFLDHRDNQDLAVFDVYYSNSLDGIKFSKNLRVNELPIINEVGGRAIGDYLDMIVAYPEKVYVAYPCGNNASATGPNAACMVEIIQSDEETITTNGCSDTNTDGIVDIYDLVSIENSMNTCSGNPKYKSVADVTGDGCVNDLDRNLISSNFNKSTNCAQLQKCPDINSDGVVDAFDMVVLSKSWFSCINSTTYNPLADITADSCVDNGDMLALVNYFNMTSDKISLCVNN